VGDMMVQSRLSIIIEMLDAIRACADTLIEAENGERISFDDQVVPAAFEILSNLIQRALATSPGELDQFVSHVREHGPDICQQMIRETVLQTPPIMHRTYLVGRLTKPVPPPV